MNRDGFDWIVRLAVLNDDAFASAAIAASDGSSAPVYDHGNVCE